MGGGTGTSRAAEGAVGIADVVGGELGFVLALGAAGTAGETAPELGGFGTPAGFGAPGGAGRDGVDVERAAAAAFAAACESGVETARAAVAAVPGRGVITEFGLGVADGRGDGVAGARGIDGPGVVVVSGGGGVVDERVVIGPVTPPDGRATGGAGAADGTRGGAGILLGGAMAASAAGGSLGIVCGAISSTTCGGPGVFVADNIVVAAGFGTRGFAGAVTELSCTGSIGAGGTIVGGANVRNSAADRAKKSARSSSPASKACSEAFFTQRAASAKSPRAHIACPVESAHATSSGSESRLDGNACSPLMGTRYLIEAVESKVAQWVTASFLEVAQERRRRGRTWRVLAQEASRSVCCLWQRAAHYWCFRSSNTSEWSMELRHERRFHARLRPQLRAPRAQRVPPLHQQRMRHRHKAQRPPRRHLHPRRQQQAQVHHPMRLRLRSRLLRTTSSCRKTNSIDSRRMASNFDQTLA